MPTIRKSKQNTRKTTARRTTSRTTAKGNTSRTSSTSRGTASGYPVSKFANVRTGIQGRLGSFRNIFSQVSGPGKVTAFSPRTAQQWFNLVNKGAWVYKFSSPQLVKSFGTKFDPEFSNTAITKFFKTKFGNAAIKGVTRGRGNTWLVATNSPINKGPFKNYTWK
jgi:hypothetical protein